MAIVAITVAAGSTWFVARRQRADLLAGKRIVAGLEAQLAARREPVSAIPKSGNVLVQSRLEGPVSAPPNPLLDHVDASTAANDWLLRVGTLQRLFADNANLSIPEIQLLTVTDWLDAARRSELGSETGRRKAMAAVRTAAKAKLAQPLAAAVFAYANAHAGSLPESPGELASLLAAPEADLMLSRYEMLLTGTTRVNTFDLPGGMSAYAVGERAPIDEPYDTRLLVNATRGSGQPGWARARWEEANFRASLEFSRANNGRSPEKYEDIQPYVASPLVNEIWQAIHSRMKVGIWSLGNVEQILPWLVTPEARAMAREIWPEGSGP